MRSKLVGWSPLVLRSILGFGAMAHGWAKLNRGPEGFGHLLQQIGVPLPHVTAWLVTMTELLCGFAILVGGLADFAALMLIITMLVAMFAVQMNYGFSSVNTIGLTPNGPIFGPPGYEINLLYIAGLISIVITGPGALAIDTVLRRRVKGVRV